jgi:hypothetical protein
MYPGFAAGLVPLASNPVEVGGRNRVWRKFLIDAIEQDPTWMNGEYKEQPRGLASAIGFTMIADQVRKCDDACQVDPQLVKLMTGIKEYDWCYWHRLITLFPCGQRDYLRVGNEVQAQWTSGRIEFSTKV